MKRSIGSISLAVLLTLGYSSHAQQIKPVSDTTGLRKEYTVLYTDIADLNARLMTAKSNLAAYHAQASTGSTKAANPVAAVNQAPKADAKRAPVATETKKDYENASQAENQRLNRLHDSIFILASEISKKQQRLQQLSVIETL